MDQRRLETSLSGLQRLEDPSAARAREFVEAAIQHSDDRGFRWTEQMCYCLRESLECIPPLFGQEKATNPIGVSARRFADAVSDAIAVDQPPATLRDLVANFEQELAAAETQRRYRIAQTMIRQSGATVANPLVDEFAREWTATLEEVNRILHGGDHTDEDALDLLDRSVDLLAALVGPVSSRLGEMDAYATMRDPKAPDVRRVVHLLADDRLARYFFTRVDSPEWVTALDHVGIFDPPLRGDWYQGGLLVRAAAAAPEVVRTIAERIVRDPHRASAVTALGVARVIGSAASDLATRTLAAPSFVDPYVVGRELETLVNEWGESGQSATFRELADMALEPRPPTDRAGLEGKFPGYEFARIVEVFVIQTDCAHLADVTTTLVYKLRRADRLLGSPLDLSWRRDNVASDDRTEREIGDALISGVRDSLARMRECGSTLEQRRRVIGELDSEILLRIWAHHLAEEEQHGS
jgi:hypothetical protein